MTTRPPEQSARQRPGLPAPHVGRPVRNCTCWLCQEHRKRDRQALRDHALGLLVDYAWGGPVRVGAAASDALRQALDAH